MIDATAGVMPALEIVDSRIQDWRIKIQDTISDSASYARVVTGGNKLVPINDLDLSMVPMASFRNGELMFTGCGAAVMASNPVNSVVWLANKMKQYGTPLQAGELILSGAFTPCLTSGRAIHVFVRFGPLGNVSLSAKASRPGISIAKKYGALSEQIKRRTFPIARIIFRCSPNPVKSDARYFLHPR